MFYTIEISKCVQKSLILITNDIFVLPSLLFTEQQQSSDTTFIFQMFVPPVFKVRLKFSVSLCLRRCDDWQWLKVAFVGPLLLFIMRGLWHPLHCLYVSYSLPRALCWSYLEPLLPKACGGRGGGWIWIAVQVCACCNLHHPPSPLGLCTILFEFKCVAEEKVPHRFPVKLYSGPLILLGCHIGPF